MPMLLNRHRLELEFKVEPYKKAPVELSTSFLALHTKFEHSRFEVLTKEQFLNSIAALLGDEKIKVRKIIQLAANKLGSHHFGFSETEKYKKQNEPMLKLYDQYKNDEFNVSGDPAILITMKSICRIALEGFEPLVEKILQIDE